jgi:hypothetical protein
MFGKIFVSLLLLVLVMWVVGLTALLYAFA